MKGKQHRYAVLVMAGALCAFAQGVAAAQVGDTGYEDLLPTRSALTREVTGADRELLAAVMGMKVDDMEVSRAGYTYAGRDAAFPRASSFLSDDGYGPYGPDRADDGSSQGAWAEGVKGPGLGSWLAVLEGWQGDLVTIFPGIGGKAWAKNNRPKDIRVLVFGLVSTEGMDGGGFVFDAEMIEIALTLPDRESWFSFRQPGRLPEAEAYLAVLVIDSVYKGSKYDDTCVSAFGLDMGQ